MTPGSYEDFATQLRDCAERGLTARVVGSGTKSGWGRPAPDPDIELSTTALDQIVEHNEGDLTAVLQAGVPLARAQEKFASANQMLSLDPPGDRATIGGVVATGDSGPLRHRYGAARDLVLGVTVALSDGTVARAGSKVIKNVAGYDLAKLFSGSFGTLGAILEVVVRLHPVRPTASAGGRGDDPATVAAAASALAHSRLEAQALDVAWRGGRGGVLARFAGAEAVPQAQAAERLLAEQGLEAQALSDDEGAWEAQRRAQRGDLVVRVSSVQTQLADVLRAADRLGGSVVGRAALGISWLSLPADAGAEAIRELRAELAPSACVVLDAPAELRAEVDPWGLGESTGALGLMRSTKARFDPQGVCSPGVFAGGI
ncbi:MAG: glycolate oxidase binding subunit [Pseudonocardiales bacterium]|nr:glycolate oxidase binding subunit [Pseudonocardiales bacterium]